MIKSNGEKFRPTTVFLQSQYHSQELLNLNYSYLIITDIDFDINFFDNYLLLNIDIFKNNELESEMISGCPPSEKHVLKSWHDII